VQFINDTLFLQFLTAKHGNDTDVINVSNPFFIVLTLYFFHTLKVPCRKVNFIVLLTLQ